MLAIGTGGHTAAADIRARPLGAGEEAVWADLCAEPEHRATLLAEVRAALAHGAPDQFWLAWRGGQPLGGLWGVALPERGYRVLELIAEAARLDSAGAALLDALEAAYQPLEVGVAGDDDALAALLAGRGMAPVGELVHVERGLGGLPPELAPLALEPAAAVTRADFERAFASALAGTRVPGLGAGTPTEVLDYLARCSPGAPDWRVARLDGDLVGVVLPCVHAANRRLGSLGFIGIVRAARGCGLGRRLHRAALGVLARAGALVYRDAAAADDAAMLRVLAAHGCDTVARERIFARPERSF